MDQDDLEKRVAELERQLAEQKRVARFVTPEEAGRLGISDSALEALTQSKQGAYTSDAWSRRQRPRRKRGALIMFGVLIAILGPLYSVVAGVTAALPSSAMWMSGIMCSSPYHMAYHNEGYQYGRAPGFRGGFQCVSGDSSYHVNYFAISVLQTLLVVLVMFGVLVVGVLMWRLLRKPR
jgi:hypothetical protein